MPSGEPYYTLVASLPPLPKRFDDGPPPISRDVLRDRLGLLRDDDRRVIDQVAGFFVWDRQPLDRTDEDVVATHRKLDASIDNALVRQIVRHRFEMRTIVASLRRKRDGEGPPPGIAPLIHSIRRHWDVPDFNLSARFRWIAPFTAAAVDGRVTEAQHILFFDLWNTWTTIAQPYHFTFESVILYLARWEIVDRWTSQNAELGRQRFENLITETLGEYANLE